MQDEIRIDRRVFEALASDTRVAILKELDERQKTVTELSASLGMAKSSVHEHLAKMVEAGLIEKEENERKWTYYRLTPKGRKILHPGERTKILVLVGSSILAFVAGVSQIFRSAGPQAGRMAMEEAAPPPPLPAAIPERGGEVLGGAGATPILGILLISAALLLGYWAYRTWRRSKPLESSFC
ncbi:MAG: winged helix-turn-helix domain-containing protein [Candidatus Hydrothermarchaeota archaeon]